MFAAAMSFAGCHRDVPPSVDLGAPDAQPDADLICTFDPECYDPGFCVTPRCAPGTAGANARGCVFLLGVSCPPGLTCNEVMRRCDAR